MGVEKADFDPDCDFDFDETQQEEPLETGIYIADFDGNGVFAAIDPESLAGSHPAWKHDVSSFGPWGAVSMSQGIRNRRVWRAEGYQGPAAAWITGTCTSSMDAARVLMRQNRMGPWSSVLALRQTVGRGRRKRSWASPPGNVYGTWYWPFTADNERLFQYRPVASLLAGDILASVFSEMGVDVRIKWPNDIVWGNRKLCGILVEEKDGHVCVGIGINLVSAPDENRMTNDAIPPVCLDPGGDSVTPLAFWTRLMESGRQRLEHVTRSMRPEQFLHALESRLAWIGTDIRVYREREAPYDATLTGLAPDGGLTVDRKGRMEVIYTATIRPV